MHALTAVQKWDAAHHSEVVLAGALVALALVFLGVYLLPDSAWENFNNE